LKKWVQVDSSWGGKKIKSKFTIFRE
jgi:hypothetical protein